MNEQTLLQEYIRNGSEQAFSELVNRYHNMVFSVCMRHLHDSGLAQDAAQAVFLALSENAEKIRKHILSGWLQKAAKYAAIDLFRKEVSRIKNEREAGHMRLQKSAASSEWKEIEPVLDDALLSLNEKDRSAVILRYFRNEHHAEIGRILGISKDAAQMRVKRAVSKLKKCFYRKGIVLSAGGLTGLITAHAIEAAPSGSAEICTSAVLGKAGADITLSSNAASVAKGVMKMMMWKKIKFAGIVTLFVLGTTVGIGVAAIQAQDRKKETSVQGTAKTIVSGCPIVPIPKVYIETGGTIRFSEKVAIVIGAKATEPEKYAAERLQTLVARRFKRKLAILTEEKAGDAGQVIALGQVSTNGLVKKLCAEAKIDMAAIAGKSKSKDGFAIEAAGGKKAILVAGSNPRGVTYGAHAFFDMLRKEGKEATLPAASVRDWPSIPWRGNIPGRPWMRRYQGSCLLDSLVRARMNVIDLRLHAMGILLGMDLSKAPVKEVIREAHRRGILVYGVVSASRGRNGDPVKGGRKLFEELAALGVDGLWISFDDTKGGKDPIGFVKMAVEVARKHGIPGRRLAFTPAGYYGLGEDEKPFVEIPGFEEAVFFITSPPDKKKVLTAERLGMKRPPGWWHNWPRWIKGMLYVWPGSHRTGGKRAYHPIWPLSKGWGRPFYDGLRDAAANCDTVMICGSSCEYTAAVPGIWAWEPKKHDWTRTQLGVFGDVFGPGQARGAMRFDERLDKLEKEFFLLGGQSWPCRLKDPARRPEALKLIAGMDESLRKIEERAPLESALAPERLRDWYLEPMRATVRYARAMATLDFPEYTVSMDKLKELAYSGKTEQLAEHVKELREKVLPVMEKVKTELAGLQGIDEYAKKWEGAVSGINYWNELREAEKEAKAKRLSRIKPKQYAPLLARASSPPAGKVLGELGAKGWRSSEGDELFWRGNLGVMAVDLGGRSAVAVIDGGKNNKGDYAEARAELATPKFTGKLMLDAFVNHTVPKDRRGKPQKGRRFLQLWVCDRMVWEGDIGESRDGREWLSVDVTEEAAANKKLRLRFRVEDRARSASGHAFLGPVRLRAE